jgi:hypothetical protein
MSPNVHFSVRDGRLSRMPTEPDLADALPDACEGWVWLKQGNWTNARYQKRWFVLQGGLLRYYESDADASSGRRVQGDLLLCGALVEGDTGSDQGPDGPLASFAITPAAVAKNRGQVCRLQCGCTNEKERDRWVGEIEAQAKQIGSLSHEKGWVTTVFGISEFAGKDFPASRLIHPTSPFSLLWLIVTCSFLIYTALVTPAVIAFHWLDDECNSPPTLHFDCVLDVFFMCDIVVNFYTGVVEGERYHDDWRHVASKYIAGSFFFDVATSIPVAFVELYVVNSPGCTVSDPVATAGSGAADINSANFRFVRIMKPLRWFKLARILKLHQSSDLFPTFCDCIGFEPRHQRLSLLFFQIFGLVHLGGCLVWFVKVLFYQDEVDEFLATFAPPGADQRACSDIGTVCGKLTAYSICTYFVCTVFSTVGFGDIAATNAPERLCYSALMLYGIMVFGNLLAELAELNKAAREDEIEKMERVQAALDFSRTHQVPRNIMSEVLRWTRFRHRHSSGDLKKKDFLDSLPMTLKRKLVLVIFGDALQKIPLFRLLSLQDETFLVEVYSYMKYITYTPGSAIVSMGAAADRLIVVVSGEMNVHVQSDDDEGTVMMTHALKPGDFIGESLQSSRMWRRGGVE